MLDVLRCIGFLLIFTGMVAGVYYARRWLLYSESGKRLLARLAGYEVSTTPAPTRPPVIITPAPTLEDELDDIEAGTIIHTLNDGEDMVAAVLAFDEKTQFDGKKDWESKGYDPLTAAILNTGEWVFKMPAYEGGGYVWLRGSSVPTRSLQSFFMGTKENPGPARKFNRAGQGLANAVDYTLPDELTPGIIWSLIDIGTFGVKSSSGNTDHRNGDLIYFIVSRVRQGGDAYQYLIYLDCRPGEAHGHSTLLYCDIFVPNVDIEAIL